MADERVRERLVVRRAEFDENIRDHRFESADGAGDLKRLQATVTALDEATKPLAEFLMDKAMEAVLRKRGLIQS